MSKWACIYSLLRHKKYVESVSLSFQFLFLISNFVAPALNFNQNNEKEIVQKKSLYKTEMKEKMFTKLRILNCFILACHRKSY